MKTFATLLLIATVLGIGQPLLAEDKTYLIDTLIIPMDTTHQDDGMLLAYGLVYDLLLNGVPVDWTIASGKNYGDGDFSATVEDLQSSTPVAPSYRGGPFVIDSDDYAVALPVVQAWQLLYPEVTVHRVTVPFNANRSRAMLSAPTIAVFADGQEDIAFDYLNAAGIPMSNGDPWPTEKDKKGEYPCPGDQCCPDCFDEVETAGPTTASHTDGALFDSNGTPRYCQFMSMHYKDPAPTPEVVAEVREFLEYPVHFFAECQAVNSFENNIHGGFLTTGGLVDENAPTAVDHHHSDDPFAQADGAYQSPGGSEPAFKLDVGSFYHAPGVVMLTNQDFSEGEFDVWINGYSDGDPTKGKVSYLGGHSYTTDMPISTNPKTQGTRYFLNSLFEAPCTVEEGQAAVSTRNDGPDYTNDGSYELSVCYENLGPGIAFDATLIATLPVGATFVSASNGGSPSGGDVVWDLGSLAAGTSACETLTVSLGAEGRYGFQSSMTWDIGLSSESSDPSSKMVTFGSLNLLRYGGITQLSPQLPSNGAIFSGAPAPAPSLDPLRDLEVGAYFSADPFPSDSSDLAPGSPPLVYYELEGTSGDSLRLAISGGRLVLTY